MKNRKTITYTEPLFDALMVLSDADRLILYDQLNGHFLKGNPLNYEMCSDTARSIMAYIAPEIRKYKQKYDAGKSEKHATTETKAALCPQNISENKRIETLANVKKKKQKENILSISKSNNIYNNVYQTNNRTRAHAYACEEKIKSNDNGDRIVVRLQELQEQDPEIVRRTQILVEQLRQGDEMIKIGGQATPRRKILSAYANLLQEQGALELLRYIYEQIDSTPGIRNPYKYTVSMLYNIATQHQTEKTRTPGMITRQYSDGELESMFDNLE